MTEESIAMPKPVRGLNRERIVFIPFDPHPGILLSAFRPKIKREKRTWTGRLFVLEDKAVLYGELGAPAAVAALESLIASGARQILVLSFCGSLSPAYKIGDVISVSRALVDEGTSPHYFPKRMMFGPTDRLKEKVERRLETRGLPFLAGSIVSTDAPFRETHGWLARMRKRKAGLVDMELSSVFALALFRAVEAAALMIVTDELFSGTWKQGTYGPEFKKKVGDYFSPFL